MAEENNLILLDKKPEVKVVYPKCPACNEPMHSVESRVVKIGDFVCLMLWCEKCEVYLGMNVVGDTMEQPAFKQEEQSRIVRGGPAIPPFLKKMH